MSFRLLENDELKKLLLTTFSSSEDHLSFYHSLKFKLEGIFPASTCEVFEYSENNCRYYYAFKENILLKRNAGLLTSDGDFEDESFLKGLHLYFEARKSILNDMKNGFLFVAYSKYTDLVINYLKSNESIRTELYPTYLFFMTEAQKEFVSNYDFPALKPGFEIGSANPETEAERITSTWAHAQEKEVEQTKMKLQHFPSSVIRHEGVPIAYEMIDHYGFLNHQFTHVEYRNQGFGRIVELDISKKCIERNFLPFKCVETNRPTVIDYSLRSPYWTMHKDEHGSPLEYMFLVLIAQI